jgi:Zn-dependent protease with chaperone function
MDFFEAQDEARRGTKKLVLLFLLAVAGMVLALNVIFVLAVEFTEDPADPATAGFDWWRPGLFTLVTMATVALVGGASAFKTLQLSGDGGKVARLLGGRRIDGTTTDAEERKIMNVVEEMSLASGVPVPDVYVMDREAGINAFAAGSTLDNAAVGVTRGTIEKLSRDELQGVMAHEFSHILNGDMKINVRLIGVIFGILLVGLLGYTVFRYAPYLLAGRRSSSNDKGGGAAVGIALFLVGGLIWLVGSVGVFFGRLIQASVSRQREYLADASAVQFTRNPAGIRDALRKIGGSQFKATINNPHAGECGHLFFGSALNSMFATHPPLPDRIKRLDKTWDGTMLKAEGISTRQRVENDARQRASRPPSRYGPLGDILGEHVGHLDGASNPVAEMLGSIAGAAAATDPTQAVAQRGGTAKRDLKASRLPDQVGQLDAEHIEYGHLLAEAVPEQLRMALRRPDLVRGAVASLFLSKDRDTRLMQNERLGQRDPEASAAADAVGDVIADLGPAGRLPVLELAAPALRQLPEREAARFLEVLMDLIKADNRIEPFEFALYKLADRFVRKPRLRERHATVESVADEAAVVLSALAGVGGDGADTAYKRGVGHLRQGHLQRPTGFDVVQLDTALNRLAEARMPVKRKLIEAFSATIAADGRVTVAEAEMLRAVAAVMQCPVPPLLDPAG